MAVTFGFTKARAEQIRAELERIAPPELGAVIGMFNFDGMESQRQHPRPYHLYIDCRRTIGFGVDILSEEGVRHARWALVGFRDGGTADDQTA